MCNLCHTCAPRPAMLYTSQTTLEKDQNVDDKSYAAKEAGGELEVYEYDPGELKPQDVEVQVDYCGSAIPICR